MISISQNKNIYISNKKYICIFSNNFYEYNSKRVDISIFDIEEWNNLLEISKVFENAVINLKNDNCKINEQFKKSSYYLYYSPYCHYEDFNKLQNEYITINELYKKIFELIKEEKKEISIDKFKKWITDNNDEIQTHYKFLINNSL